MRIKTLAVNTALATLLGLAATTNAAELQLAFTDSAWNGEGIPEGQMCNRFNKAESKNPESPEVVVKGIPADADAIILYFSDRSFARMDNGGHGTVGYKIQTGSGEVTVPRVPGHTEDLPENFWTVKAHGAPTWDTAGAYLPPCSGGRGNNYFIDVKAVKLGDNNDVSNVLAEGSIKLATF